jgi:hypothetical protein
MTGSYEEAVVFKHSTVFRDVTQFILVDVYQHNCACWLIFNPEDDSSTFLQMSVNIYQTAQCNIPEDNHHLENLEYHALFS